MAGQLTGLHAKFTGDASSFASAARLSAFETNKLNAKLAENKRKNEEASNSAEGVARSLHKLRMETDNTYAGMVRYQKAATLVKQISDSQKWSDEQLGAELQRLAAHYNVTAAAGFSAGESMKSARFHAANLGAQFNDIGVMLASGQNPLMLAVQQGTQISQILMAAGGSAKEMKNLLVSSFTAITSPMALLTIGIIAGGAALIQWAYSASGAKEEAAKLKAEQEKLITVNDNLTASIKRLRDERALATSGAGSMEELAGQQAVNDLMAQRAALQAELAANLQRYGRAGGVGAETVATAEQMALTAQINQIDAKLTLLRYEEKLTTAERLRANQYRDAAAARFQAEADLAANQAQAAIAEQKQIDLARLRISYFHQLAGEYSAVSTTALSMVTTAAQLADQEQRQANLAKIKKDYFHMLAGETSSVSTYMGTAAAAAEDLASTDINSGIALAASSAMTLAKNMGVSLDAARKLLAAGYEAPGPVVYDPRDPNYDPAAVARAQAAAKAAQLRMDFSQPSATTAAGVSGAGVGTGAGGGVDQTQAELEQLQNSLRTQEQLEIESYQRRQQMLKDALAQKLLTQQEYTGLIEQSEAQHQFNMLKETNAGVSSTLNSLGQLFQGSKQVSAGIALANSYLAFTEVLKDPSYIGRPFARFAAAAAALSSGLSAVRSIKSAQPGGATSGGISAGSAGGGGGSAGGVQTSTQVSLQLVGGDLYSRDQVLQLINAINSATADGAQILLR